MDFTIRRRKVPAAWQRPLRDFKARVVVAWRIERAEHGNLGWTQCIGKGISELRVDVGAGYRVYFTIRPRVPVALLCGSYKKSQPSDIKRAQPLGAPSYRAR